MDIEKFYDCLSQEEKTELINFALNKVDIKETFSKLTPISVWVNSQRLITTRLRNVLLTYSDIRFVEQVNQQSFMCIRNAGKNTWSEFTKLRGY